MDKSAFDAIGVFVILFAVFFVICFTAASFGYITLKSENWECTQSAIIKGKATCTEYRLKGST